MRSTIILCLSFLLISFTACKKNENEAPKIYVPAYIRAMAPYTNGQVVSFSNGTGMVVQSTVNITSKFEYDGVCGSCTANHESITYTFKAGPAVFIKYVLSTQPYYALNIASPLDNYVGGGIFDFIGFPDVSQFSCGAQNHACYPSITLNNKTFTDVLEVSSASSTLVKAYFTVSRGIVGFKHSNGTVFALD